MKKLIPFIAIFILTAFVLSACTSGSKTVTATPEPVEPAQPTTEPTPEPTPEPTAEPEPEPTAAEPDDTDWEALRVTAEQYLDKDVSELIAAIGEPAATDYASSCLGPGDDGELIYGGFTVYTYKEGDSEIVKEVV